MNQDNKKQALEDWRNEHGEPDFDYLQALAADGSPEALEKLQSIAEDLDVDVNTGSSAEDLLEKISQAVRENESERPVLSS